MIKDQEYAQKILEHRKRGGYSIRLALRGLASRYIISTLVFILAAIFLLNLSPCTKPFYWVIIGLYAGMILRDIGWFWAIKKTWPFSEKITDWEKVERLARGENK